MIAEAFPFLSLSTKARTHESCFEYRYTTATVSSEQPGQTTKTSDSSGNSCRLRMLSSSLPIFVVSTNSNGDFYWIQANVTQHIQLASIECFSIAEVVVDRKKNYLLNNYFSELPFLLVNRLPLIFHSLNFFHG